MGFEYDLAIVPNSEPPSSSDASRNVCEWDMKRGLVFLAINCLKRSGRWEQAPVPKELREEGDGFALNAFSTIRRKEWDSMCEELQRVGRIERTSLMKRAATMHYYRNNRSTERQLFWEECTETFWFLGEETNRDFAFVYERIDHNIGPNSDAAFFHHWLHIPSRLDLRQRNAGISLWLSGRGRMLYTINMMNNVLTIIVDRFPALFRIIDFDGGFSFEGNCNVHQFYSGKWCRYQYGKTILWKGPDVNKESEYLQVNFSRRLLLKDALTLNKL